MPLRKRSLEDEDEGSRKRLKPFQPAADIIELDSDQDQPSNMAATAPSASDGEALSTIQLLHADFETLRSIVTCKVCERLLYEPYQLSCGHTYCYSCLCTWFHGKKKKTCPNCRDVIKQMPALSYLIKEMTSVFIGRSHLLPDGETSEQHAQWQKEEAEIIQADKSCDDPRSGGLFKGCFNGRGGGLGPIMDLEDGVERCPGCNWEIEDGMCNNCGFLVDEDFHIGSGDEISDDVSDELDEDEVDQDDFDADDADFGAYGPAVLNAPQGFRDMYRAPRRALHLEDDEEEEDEEDDEDHSMDGFIVDEADESDVEGATVVSSDNEFPSSDQPPHRIRRRVVINDSEEDDEDEYDREMRAMRAMRARNLVRNPVRILVHDSESEDQSDFDPDVVDTRPNMRNVISRRDRAPITIVDSDAEDLDSDSDEEESEMRGGPTERPSESLADESSVHQYSDDDMGSDAEGGEEEHYGFSPLQSSIDNAEEDYDQYSDAQGDEHNHWPGSTNDVAISGVAHHRPNPHMHFIQLFEREAPAVSDFNYPDRDLRRLLPRYIVHSGQRLDSLTVRTTSSHRGAPRNAPRETVSSSSHRHTSRNHVLNYGATLDPESETLYDTDPADSSDTLQSPSPSPHVLRRRSNNNDQIYRNMLRRPMTLDEMIEYQRDQRMRHVSLAASLLGVDA